MNRILAALALLLTLSLAGCETYARGPAVVSREGANLLIAPCVEMNLKSGMASYEAGGDAVIFWDVEGSAHLSPGEALSLSEQSDGLSGDIGTIPVDEVSWLIVRLTDDKVDFNAGFRGESIPGLEEGEWLHTDGRVTTAPCDGESP